jgi:hypothetical protein
MKVAGFTFIRNAIINDYPIVEAITSILPICDEFIVAVGNCEDDTRNLILNINSPKIKIVDTVWDEDLREGGQVFALETDKAFAAISKDIDWAFYIQGDECVHEKYLPIIKKEMEAAIGNSKIEGLLFKYLHFYGSYDYYAESRKWYRREIRVIKRKLNVKSFRDAQGFRIDNRKIRVKLIDAYIYHYGWVKPPYGLISKMQNFNLFYDKNAIKDVIPTDVTFDYGNADKLNHFTETHPKSMLKRVGALNWKYKYDPTVKSTHPFRIRILEKIFKVTGIRIGEYKNYKIST